MVRHFRALGNDSRGESPSGLREPPRSGSLLGSVPDLRLCAMLRPTVDSLPLGQQRQRRVPSSRPGLRSGPAGPVASTSLRRMSQAHTVDELGRYDGLTLAQAVPLVVDEIVAALKPVEIILFGSVARGDDGPDSDIDVLVVFDAIEPSDKRTLMRTTRAAVQTFVPLDIIVADLAEIAADRINVGSAVYWPLREGVSVYRRPTDDAN